MQNVGLFGGSHALHAVHPDPHLVGFDHQHCLCPRRLFTQTLFKGAPQMCTCMQWSFQCVWTHWFFRERFAYCR